MGLSVVAEYGILNLVAVVVTLAIVPSVMVGKVFTTVPLRAMFWVVAPLLTQVMLPLVGLEVAAAMRT